MIGPASLRDFDGRSTVRWVHRLCVACMLVASVAAAWCGNECSAMRPGCRARRPASDDGPEHPPVNITFGDLSLPFERDQLFAREDLPSSLKRLHGRRVRVVGWAMPLDNEPTISLFILRQDEQLDPRGPKLFRDELIVEMRPGNFAESHVSPLIVTGRLVIRDLREGYDDPISVWCLEDATVTTVQPKESRDKKGDGAN